MDNRILLNGSWLFYVLLCLALFPILLYFIFFYHKQNDFNSSWLYLRITFITVVIFGGVYALYSHVLDIYLTLGASDDSTVSWLFTLINALLLGAFSNLLGLFTETKSAILKYSVFFGLVIFALSGFGYLGIMIYLNYPFTLFLNYRKIQTNSSTISYFILFNILVFTLIIFISFLSEREIGS